MGVGECVCVCRERGRQVLAPAGNQAEWPPLLPCPARSGTSSPQDIITQLCCRGD